MFFGFVEAIFQYIEDFGYWRFLLYFAITVTVTYIVGRIRAKRFYERRIHADKKCPANHNAFRSARQIGDFLNQRRGLLAEGKPFTLANVSEREDVYSGKYLPLIHLIRVCHFYGCEVEIRQVTKERTKPEVTDDELVTFMRPEFYE